MGKSLKILQKLNLAKSKNCYRSLEKKTINQRFISNAALLMASLNGNLLTERGTAEASRIPLSRSGEEKRV